MVHVLLVMPRAVVRHGLAEALREGDVRVSEAEDVLVACELARGDPPDVALVELDRGGPHRGLTLAQCRELLDETPLTHLLPLVEATSPQLAKDALDAGARGVFEMSGGLDLLRRAVRVVDEGEVWLSRKRMSELIDGATPSSGPEPAARPALSTREREVLVLLADGRGHRAIAEELFVSPHTVRTHIRNIMRKLGAHSRLEAVARGQAEGLLSGPDL